MEVMFTFGSLGDIIAVCQVVIELNHALSDSQGSAKEYQDLRNDLSLFGKVLTEVVAAYQQHEFSPYLNDLDAVTKEIIKGSASLVQEVLDRWREKYYDYLKPGGSGDVMKNGFKKLEWSLRERERIKQLQDKLRTDTQRIALLTSLVVQRSARVDNATLLARIEEVKVMVCKYAEVQEALLQQQQLPLANAIECQNIQLKTLRTITSTFTAITEVKQLLGQVSQAVVGLQFLASNRMFFAGLDPTRGMPVTFEDALGTVLEFPLEWVHDWKMFSVLLEHHFEKLKGYQMVVRQQYALEESCSGKDLDRNQPLSICIRRGMKINMAMVFDGLEIVSGSCPRCKTACEVPDGINVQCKNEACGLWFRLEKQKIKTTPLPKHVGTIRETATVEEPSTNVKELKTEAVPDEPSDFQRVRLIDIKCLFPPQMTRCKFPYCNHGRVANPTLGRSFYCREHTCKRTVWDHSGKQRFCRNPRDIPSKFCYSHTRGGRRCNQAGCETIIRSSEVYCIIHGCEVKGCHRPRDGGNNSESCREHTCHHQGCTQLVHHVDRSTAQYCMIHGCKETGCDSHTAVRGGYCLDQHGCVTQGCPNKRSLEPHFNNHCWDHRHGDQGRRF